MFLLRLCHPVSFPRIWEPQSLDHLVAEHASTSNGIPWTIIDAMGSLLRLCQQEAQRNKEQQPNPSWNESLEDMIIIGISATAIYA